ncbi:MAG: response regulator [Chitinophagaceae bacterium]|nr:response regulator [Chitinophagaceae bacterium]
MKRFWLTILFFAIALVILFFAVRKKTSVRTDYTVQQALLNLSNKDVSYGTFSLKGKWEFYWQQLLFPDDLSVYTPSYVSFPSLWNDIELNGRSLSSKGYATYKFRLILPSQRPEMALEIPDTYSTYALYINGKLLAGNGKPAIQKEDAVPFWNTNIVTIPHNEDTLNIVMQVANFWHSKGGTYRAPILGNSKELKRVADTYWAMDVFVGGALIMSGLIFFGLYLFARHDKSILYFSIFCLIYSYRLFGTEPYILHGLMPQLSWFFTIRMEYISLALSIAFFIQYVRYLYPEEAGGIFLKVLFWMCLIYAGVIIVAPVQLFTAILPVYLVVLFFYIGYAFYIFMQASRHGRSGSEYAFLSSGVALILFLVINLAYFGITTPMKEVVSIGYILFLFLQSLILSFRFSFALKKSAEEAQQGLKAKSEFLSTISHEIRTPLNAIIGMTHLMMHNQPREDQKENLQLLLFSSNNLLSIVNDILDFNKLETRQIDFEEVDMSLKEIGENVIRGQRSAADEKGVLLKCEIDAGIPDIVKGDPVRLAQIINNLVNNAIKFTDRGYVTLYLFTEALDKMNVTVKIAVEDTGIGISPEKQKIIFEGFTQVDSSASRSRGGAGLGLAISKKILDQQNIPLRLQSEPGIGSTFWFTQTFPVVMLKAVTTPFQFNKSILQSKPLQRRTILLAEDNSLNVLVAQSILEEFGARVDIASNGEEAIKKFKPAVHDIILMDLNMPVKDGFEATKALRKEGSVTPIIALTASTPEEVFEKVKAAGFNDIIVKPFNPDILCRTILKHLGVV